MVLEKTLESPLDCKELKSVHPKGNQSWIFTGGLIMKLKLQYFGHLMLRTHSLEKTLKLEWLTAWGKGDDRGWDGWKASLTWWTWVWASSEIWWRTGQPGMLQSMGMQRVECDWVTELNWFTYLYLVCLIFVAVHGLSLVYVGFSLRWPLLIQSTSSRWTGGAQA